MVKKTPLTTRWKGRSRGQHLLPSALRNIFRAAHLSKWIPLLLLCVVSLLVVSCDFLASGSDSAAAPTNTPIRGRADLSHDATPLAARSRQAQPSAPTAVSAKSPAQSPVPSAVPTSLVPLAANLDMAQAWGAAIHRQVQHIPIQPNPTTFLLVQSVTQDGKFLLASANPSDPQNSANQQSSAVMVDIASGQATEIGRVPNPAGATTSAIQVYEIHSDQDWIVWTQAPQEPGFFSDWALYAYNRTDHSTKEIARAAKNKNGLPALGSDGSAQIDHGTLVWTEGVPDLINSQRSLLKLLDMPTGQVTTLSANGWSPKLSWPNLAWIELQSPPDGSPTPGPGEAKAQVVVLNLENGTRKLLTRPNKPSYIALYKDSFAWISNDSKRVLLTDLAETFERTIAVAQGGDSFQDPSLNDRLITWGDQLSKVEVWDRKQNRIITIGPKGHQLVSARNLVWVGPTNAPGSTSDEIKILDTTQLP